MLLTQIVDTAKFFIILLRSFKNIDNKCLISVYLLLSKLLLLIISNYMYKINKRTNQVWTNLVLVTINYETLIKCN